MGARSPVKFMDVCDVKVIDEDVLMASNMMINAKNTFVKERIWIDRVALCCTCEEPNLHLDFCLRDVTDGMRSPRKLPVEVVSMNFSGGDHSCEEN